MSLLMLLLACTGYEPEPVEWPALQEGAPMAGAAERTLDLPLGTPMAGYSARCNWLSGHGRQDYRDSAYSTSFSESAGMHMRPTLKAVWIDNGDDSLVVIKADVIYSYDNLVVEITRQLEAATGEDLRGRVVLATTHSHFSYGAFSDQAHFYLGGDLYNEEIFQRFALQATDVALQAYESREPAKIGAGWAKDWDPNNRVYRDRRGVNNDVAMWEDVPVNDKDPYLNVLRIDSIDDAPIAVVFTFGIHGIVLPDSSGLISPDSTGGLEQGVQEAFDEPVVVMHLQGAGGDASPAGRDDSYARVESLGELAREPIMDLWRQTPTSADPILLDTVSQHVWQYHDQIRVTRDGTVNWYYSPLGEDGDDVVFDEHGKILSPIDEFNAPFGAAFCGDGSFEIPVGDIGSDVFPYDTCMDVELMTNLLYGFFDLPLGSIDLPLPESWKAGTTSSRMGPLPTLLPDGTIATQDLYTGFFPGEPLAMFSEQWRRRVQDELGYNMPLLVGYAQDHEGYLLIPEDWMRGGYEPNIAIWGPLQGEHIMERMIEDEGSLLQSDVREDPDPYGWHTPTEYPKRPLPTLQPDLSPDAGTRLTTAPEYFYTPPGFTLVLDTPASVERVKGSVQLAWLGGDPAVDLPVVTLERQDGQAWQAVRSHSGRPITDAFSDILVAWTPHPLYPASEDQTHSYWLVWQAVGHDFDRAGLPTGTYRLRVEGKRYTGGDEVWPWSTEDYELTTDAFELVPTTLELLQDGDGLWASVLGPADGYRLIDIDGSSRGHNPVRGEVTISVTTASGTTDHQVTASEVTGGKARFPIDLAGALSVTLTDAWGNSGTLSFL